MIIAAVLAYAGLKRWNEPSHLNKQKTEPPVESHGYVYEDFPVVGMRYYLEDIYKLATLNPNYESTVSPEKRVFKYYFKNHPTTLAFDPQNEHDANAIRVLIDGVMIGFISAEENLRVGEILRQRSVAHISSFIGGGKYKIGAVEDERDLHATVTIEYK